ncbi:hypothetical protein PF005_g9869 [Phytophthora fragariae]|uniref:Uncharacterized protein n=1 Tax=Phytophthora fragariae TaxID=53985 RepID=A0A6A3FAK0_9STRA|nr:hypothetical protein PF003_g8650 [Phytophthora fragariae]KAE8939148.1 hypothetical protein PF009_g11002 [Phytophthora fragariae]KAE9115580.1 hypothetical protein PF007_g9971 [Phytophthora fragariae]KAE9115838.1 hypothetical protein PF010_g9178 [Phytophthora fragariae]KAE9146026.1 hypothetical protein PF006_g9167 [Phytophthora fragariae]
MKTAHLALTVFRLIAVAGAIALSDGGVLGPTTMLFLMVLVGKRCGQEKSVVWKWNLNEVG